MGLFNAIFGTYSDRQLKKLEKTVNEIEALAPQYSAMSDAQLQAVTPQLKERLANGESTDDILPQAFAAVREADNAKIRAAAQALGSLPDALADEINELSTDETGDILLEDCGDGWRVLDDYRDRLDEILSETRKGD